MKIIIAPAKKMVVDVDTFNYQALPALLDQTTQLLARLRTFNYAELKQLWHCSDKLAQSNYDWLQKMDLHRQLTPAILSYSGIQYQYMAPDLFTDAGLAYIQDNLRILSGFYGCLRPFDGVVPYRLEMQSKLTMPGAHNLYDFWDDQPYHAVTTTAEPIINLASQEYAKAIRPYLAPQQATIDIVFATEVDGRLKTKATLAKMARGEMVRYLAEHQITTLAGVREFDHPHYRYAAEESTEQKIVFIQH